MHSHHRHGAALATVLFAMTILGVIAAGALAIGSQEAKVGDNARYSAKSFNAAEAGVAEQLAAWNTSKFDTLTPGDSVTVAAAAIGGGYYSGVVKRLSTPVFVVMMTGSERQTNGLTQARVGQVVVVRAGASIVPKAAITTEGTVQVSGNADISGMNTAPPLWTGCASGPSVPGISVPNASNVSVKGNSTVTGSGTPPSVAQDTTIHASTFTNLGGTTYTQLASSAGIQLAAGTYNGMAPAYNASGSCNTSVSTNWGDGQTPTGACGTYFPVIHIAGTANITGGEGQGILLVDGDLKLAGGFTFFGIVIVQGTFDPSGNGTIYGAVMAQNSANSTDKMAGNGEVQYSSCAVAAALAGDAASAQPLAARGWFTF